MGESKADVRTERDELRRQVDAAVAELHELAANLGRVRDGLPSIGFQARRDLLDVHARRAKAIASLLTIESADPEPRMARRWLSAKRVAIGLGVAAVISLGHGVAEAAGQDVWDYFSDRVGLIDPNAPASASSLPSPLTASSGLPVPDERPSDFRTDEEWQAWLMIEESMWTHTGTYNMRQGTDRHGIVLTIRDTSERVQTLGRTLKAEAFDRFGVNVDLMFLDPLVSPNRGPFLSGDQEADRAYRDAWTVVTAEPGVTAVDDDGVTVRIFVSENFQADAFDGTVAIDNLMAAGRRVIILDEHHRP